MGLFKIIDEDVVQFLQDKKMLLGYRADNF